ncbi:hypothetical protein [Streptomyces sp. R44]|uniref:Uncharacterized protein n=1 Tax=Streptomyces sp. R44 TaxID=3238633 RepID=A0AB39T895_9ACTN
MRERSEEGEPDGPAVPAQAGSGAPAEEHLRGVDPSESEVTRLLCQALHARPDRVRAVKAWWVKVRGRGEKQAKPRRSSRRRIYLEGGDDCPPLGEPMAQWVLDHVLHGPRLPVPSYGFDAMPVLAHSLRARRRRRVRRIAVLVLVVSVACAVPRPAAVWGLALLVALVMWWAALRAARNGKRSRLARSPRVAYFVLSVPLLCALVPWKASGSVISMRAGILLLPVAWLAAAALACTVDRMAARAAMARTVRNGAATDCLPWSAVRARRRAASLEEGQARKELPYDQPERFVGAGRDVWGVADISIPLKHKDPLGRIELSGETELLDRVGAALDELGGSGDITDPLPGFSVAQVLGLPSALWLQRIGAPKVTLPDLRGRGRRSPSSVPDRLYLRAQCVSWAGQIVVNVFVHAALEAGELRLTVRPHVMTPLYNELRVADAPLSKRGVRLLGWVALQGLLDAAGGPFALFRFVRRLALREPGVARTEEKDPVSLRDRYSMEEITDMHQSDDAKRHVVLMQTCIFRSVAAYLEELGIDTARYHEQVAMVITNIQVYGDNNAPIQNVAGSGISQVGQEN